MSTKSISIKESLKFAFNKTVENWLFAIGVLLSATFIIFCVTSIGNGIATLLSNSIPYLGALLALILQVVLALFNMYIAVGLLYCYIKLYKEGSASFTDLFAGMPFLKSYVIVTILFGLITGVGFLLFIIPGIILALKYLFYQIIVVDEKTQAIEALKRSGQLTDGAKWQLFLFLVILYVLNIAGALCFVIGLLFTVPMTIFAMLYIYNELLEQTDNAQKPA